jgi:hypothetical protein
VIRIVGVQRNVVPEQEFLLLQNQGGLRVKLRGHVVMSECAVEAGSLGHYAHVFSDDVVVPAGMYVLLSTGAGECRWARTRDGQMIYYGYMHRTTSLWETCPGPVHILAPHHTFVERGPALLLR